MHTDDQIHKIMIAAMFAEHDGHVESAQALINVAAALHVNGFAGQSSYFGDTDSADSPPGVF
ncbi:hypothetical protein [Rhodobacter ferrooxidans]|uniref:Uncharacterized protein n=1 Tax=Rhodobacter ferrooxidans TaxID=371731 RepID=C8S5P0_9RHOB|nr:hypothetical protein [Rhodobacter sp. SW2]EEW23698.1 hypothetical protein Rsw2DRAFT_3369 [Rhodobacter sp. SW2]